MILPDVIDEAGLEQGTPAVEVLGFADLNGATMTAQSLADAQSSGAVTLIDVGLSRDYQAGHIPGAAFSIRARLGSVFADTPPTGALVFTSGDGIMARLAAADATRLTGLRAHGLTGGNQAWTAHGFSLTSDMPNMLNDAIDIWRRPYEKDWGAGSAMQAYLDWEFGLVAQLERDQTVRFSVDR